MYWQLNFPLFSSPGLTYWKYIMLIILSMEFVYYGIDDANCDNDDDDNGTNSPCVAALQVLKHDQNWLQVTSTNAQCIKLYDLMPCKYTYVNTHSPNLIIGVSYINKICTQNGKSPYDCNVFVKTENEAPEPLNTTFNLVRGVYSISSEASRCKLHVNCIN